MTPTEGLVVAFALLTFKAWQFGITGYGTLPPLFHPATDVFGEAHARRRDAIRSRYGSTWTLPVGASVVAFLLVPAWSGSDIDPHGLLRTFALTVGGIVAWRSVTMDVDLATGERHLLPRLLTALAWVGLWVHPGFLVLLLHTAITWLRAYQHHQHLPIRALMMMLACFGAVPLAELAAPLLGSGGTSDVTTPALFLLLLMSASHYFIPGRAKLRLGPRWFSWMWDNRLHAIVPSAYSWGWLRFLPEELVVRVARRLRPWDRPNQVATTALELGAILVLFDPRVCLALLVAFIAFQALVAVLSGIVFWQYMVTNALLVLAVTEAPPPVTEAVFGGDSGIVAAALILLLPKQKRIWNPLRLGWWDTPFAGRVHWEVRGESGTWYGLYNNFMCPNDRVFGQRFGDVLCDEMRITSHLGETGSRRIAEALWAVGRDLTRLERAKEELGTRRDDAELAAVHDRYMSSFVRNFNAGRRKRVCPAWLKAPGGQFFYWGRLPRFRGQEPIAEWVTRYREEYFDGERLVTVTDRELARHTPSPP